MAYTIARVIPTEATRVYTISTSNHHEVRPAEHSGIELNFDSTGHLQSKIGGREFILDPGQLVVFNPKQEHTEIHQGTSQVHKAITLSDRYVGEFLGSDRAPNLIFDKPEVINCRDAIQLARQIHDLGFSSYLPAATYDQLCEELLFVIFENSKPQKGDSELLKKEYYPQLVRRIKKRLIESIDDMEMSLGKLAHEFHMSKFHFSRIFKKAVGVSPMRYLRNLRIEYVSCRLSAERSTITQLVYEAGFGSMSSFYEAFFRHTGYSPVEFASSPTSSPSSYEVNTYRYLLEK